MIFRYIDIIMIFSLMVMIFNIVMVNDYCDIVWHEYIVFTKSESSSFNFSNI